MTPGAITAQERGPTRGSRGAQAPFAGGALGTCPLATVREDVTGLMDPRLGPVSGPTIGPLQLPPAGPVDREGA